MTPQPVLAIACNTVFELLNVPGFKVGKSININFVGVPSFIISLESGEVSSSSLYCFKDRRFIFLLLR